MKPLFAFMLLLLFKTVHGQTITARVVDALNNKPLSYAIVLYGHQQIITYTNIEGYFTLAADSIKRNDTLIIQFIGYHDLPVLANDLKNGMILRMTADVQSLQPVIVSTCKRFDEYELNKKTGRIKQYIGPGPETRLIIMARYNNISGTRGYVSKINILMNEIANLEIPVRLRWYEWNTDKGMPGKELTDTNILVYPYKKGWNDFELPAYSFPCAKDWIVIGLEFMYTAEYKEHYTALTSSEEKIKWLNDMQNRWSLAMQYVTNENESGFYIVNNGAITPYSKKYDRYFIRPALRFTIQVCKE